MFWKIYFYFVTLLLIFGYSTVDFGDKWIIIDLVISLPSLLVLFLYAYQKKYLGPQIWQIYTVAFIIFDILINIFIYPISFDTAIGYILLFPLYASLYLYSFRFFGKKNINIKKQSKTNKMFKQLTNFGYKRSPKQAFGFYLAYILLTMLIAMIIGGIVGRLFINTADSDAAFEAGLKIGNVVAFVISIILNYTILKQKKLYLSFPYLLLALFSILLTMLFGALIGYVPMAYMSTKSTKEKNANLEKNEKLPKT